jgi:hypothetical protein
MRNREVVCMEVVAVKVKLQGSCHMCMVCGVAWLCAKRVQTSVGSCTQCLRA